MKIIPTYCCGRWRQGRCSYCPVAKARERSIAKVDDHMKAWWRQEAFDSADRVMRRLDIFTTDDIWMDLERRGVPRPHEPRAMGVITRSLVDLGQAEWTREHDLSKLPWANGRTIKVYKTLV